MQVADALKRLQEVLVRLQGTGRTWAWGRDGRGRRLWRLVGWSSGFDDGPIRSQTYQWQSVNTERFRTDC